MRFFLIFLICNIALLSQEIDSSRAIIINNQVSKFKNILLTSESHFVDSVDLVKISEAAFKAMLKELDKQAFYWTESEYKNIVNQQKGVSSYGIGLSFLAFQDTIYISDVQENSQADSLGIEIGDIVLFVEGTKVSGANNTSAINKVNGEHKSQVNLIIKNSSEVGLNEINLTRESFPVSSIAASFMISNTNIGYIKINTFSQSTYSDLIEKINNLKENGLKKLIIDLRDNPGGLLDEAVKVIGLFIEKDSLVTKLEGRNNSYDKIYKSSVDPIFNNIPLSVLVNKETASSSEIFAGVMQDYDRAIIVGEKTFGKGTVQNAWVFGDSSAFRMTIAKYTTPSGRPIEKIKQREEMNIDTRFLDEKIKKDLEKTIEMFGGASSAEIYHSRAGRLIIANGGVIPDIKVDADSLTLLTQVYIERNYITEYALKYYIENKKNLIDKYKNDYRSFIEKFEITDKMLNDFAKVIDQYKVFNKDMYEKDKIFILNYLKSKIAQFAWGDDAFNYGLIYIDKQTISAIKSIPNNNSVVEKK